MFFRILIGLKLWRPVFPSAGMARALGCRYSNKKKSVDPEARATLNSNLSHLCLATFRSGVHRSLTPLAPRFVFVIFLNPLPPLFNWRQSERDGVVFSRRSNSTSRHPLQFVGRVAIHATPLRVNFNPLWWGTFREYGGWNGTVRRERENHWLAG